MAREEINKKLRISGALVVAGLLVQLISLCWNSPLAFMLFLSVGGGLVGIGILFFVWSLASVRTERQ